MTAPSIVQSSWPVGRYVITGDPRGWQGIVRALTDGLLVLTRFSWLGGRPTSDVLVPIDVARAENWQFFEDPEEFHRAACHEMGSDYDPDDPIDAPRASRRAVVHTPTVPKTVLVGPRKRPYLPATTRSRIMERDDFRCRRCGAGPREDRLVVDHVMPVARGGSSDDDNLQTLCETCNSGKSAKPPHPHDLEFP